MPDSDDIILKAADVTRRVNSPNGDLTILDSVGLTIRKGEAVAIVGPSGSGKSTLLGILAGLDNVTEGEVWLDGLSLSSASEDDRSRLRAGRVGFVFQSFHLLPGLTALENVALPLELANEANPRARANSMLAEVGLAERVDHYPNQLSGGEQQRVALARAFAIEPSVLFADEPTGNLDKSTGDQVADAMFELRRQRNTTLVLVTHDPNLANRCDTVMRMEAGKMAAEAA
ncbi:MAG: ABC transporter ATP-binding protein [Pseudomonadota bacterium]